MERRSGLLQMDEDPWVNHLNLTTRLKVPAPKIAIKHPKETEDFIMGYETSRQLISEGTKRPLEGIQILRGK